tara:strand:+ start:347 stop:784 length:438 start_codon:yes stop_codon:yes gene_type:complete
LFHLKPATATAQSVLDLLYLVSNSRFGEEWTVTEFCGELLDALTAEKVLLQYLDDDVKPVAFTTYCFLTEEEATLNEEEGFYPSLETYQRKDGDQIWSYWTVVSKKGNGFNLMRQARNFLRPTYGVRPVYFFRDYDLSKTHRGSL